MKVLISLIFILNFSLLIWADVPVYDKEKGEWVTSKHAGRGIGNNPTEEKKPLPEKNCMGAVFLSIGIFLLGQHLIKKSQKTSEPEISTSFAGINKIVG